MDLPNDDEHVAQRLADDLFRFAIMREERLFCLHVQVAEQRSAGTISPQNWHRVAAAHKLTGVGLLKTFLVLDPLVPVAKRVVVSFVLQNLKIWES